MLSALVLAASLAAVSPPRFTWPLKAYDGLAASFGEYRGDRLHTGIDLKTRAETGWEVLAAADGEVFRLKDEWRGYGLAVYVKHADGYVTLYGHLERFAEGHLHLASLLGRARRGKRHAGDVYLDHPVRVRRGETIAFSGESGFGLPHLHFEVRRGEDMAVDPLRHGLEPRPGETLSLTRLHLLPASATSLIDGRRGPTAVVLAHPEAAKIPVISGPVRLALEAVAGAGAANPIGLRGIDASLDGRSIAHLELSEIPFARSFRAGAVFDLGLTRFGPTAYVYRLDGFGAGELPGLAGAEPPLSLAPGVHTLSIRAEAAAGTIAEVSVKLNAVVETATGTSGEAAPGSEVEAWPEGILLRAGGRQQPALTLAAVNEVRTAAAADRVIAYVRATSAKPCSLTHAGLTLDIPGGALYADTYLAAVAEKAAHWPIPAGLTLLAGPYAVLPDALPFRQAATIALQAPSERAGIYGLDALTGAWGYIDDRAADGGVAAKVWRSGVYAVLRDDAPPVLSDPTPAAGAAVAAREPLRPSIAVKDLGMDVAEDGVSMSLDGRELRVSFDPDRDRASADETLRLKPGRHELAFAARDRAGNQARPLTLTFLAR